MDATKIKELADTIKKYVRRLDDGDCQVTIKCDDGIGYVLKRFEWLAMCGDHSVSIHTTRNDDNSNATVEIDDDELGTVRLFIYMPSPYNNIGMPADSIDTIEYGYRHETGGYTRYYIYRRDGKTMPASVVY